MRNWDEVDGVCQERGKKELEERKLRKELFGMRPTCKCISELGLQAFYWGCVWFEEFVMKLNFMTLITVQSR